MSINSLLLITTLLLNSNIEGIASIISNKESNIYHEVSNGGKNSIEQHQANIKCSTSNYELAAMFSKEMVEKLIGSTKVLPFWFENSNKFWYSYKTPQGRRYYLVDPEKGTKKLLFDNAKMAARLTEIVKNPYDAANLPLERFLLEGDSVFTFTVTTPQPGAGVKVQGFRYDFQKDILREVKDYKMPKFYPVWGSVSPDKKYAVYSQEFNLYLLCWEDYEKSRNNPSDSTIKAIQLTFDGSANFSYGPNISNIYTVDKEKKMKKRPEIVWSPDSKRFALIRIDERDVKDLWVVNSLSEPRPKLDMYKYQMPGEKEAPKRHLYVYDIDEMEINEVPIQHFKDQDIIIHKVPRQSRIQFNEIKIDYWEGTDERFYVTVTSRDHKRIDFCEILPIKNEINILIEERMNSYIESKPPVVLENNIVWWSERDGWAHLYNYDMRGNLIGRVTGGEFHVDEIVATDTLKKRILFTANGVDPAINPYYTHLYQVGLDGENMANITPGDFDNKPFVSADAMYVVNNLSRVDTAPASILVNAEGKQVITLEESDLSLLFGMGYKFPEQFKVKAADGITDLYGVMYKPYDFDSTKQYPVIEHVYPGPQTEAVNTSWDGVADQTDRLAQLGFIVVTIGNRGGHPARSKWYHNFGYGNIRDYGLEDKKYAIEQLSAKYPFIDKSKVGIHGHSGGGFMTAAALFKYPDFFKVGVSISGNHDNRIYNRFWGERYQGVTEVISAKGDTTFLFNVDKTTQIANNLKGHLLLITGDQDNNVHPAHTYRLANALIKANKRFDMFVFPGQRHNFGQVSEYLFWLTADYFSKHLIGDFQDGTDFFQINN